MLYDPERHQTLRAIAWSENRVRGTIAHIVADTEAHFSEESYWPLHPLDRRGGLPADHVETSLYDGACGVFWALRYLGGVGAAALPRSHDGELDRLAERDRAGRGESREWERASLLIGETPFWMMAHGMDPSPDIDNALEALISGNVQHPARELMWGSPGTMLAALFLHERTGNRRWAELFRLSAGRLWSELQWSPNHQCAYWTQEFLGGEWAYLDAVHGFVATALPLIRGRHLLPAEDWSAWERCIENTVARTVDRLGDQVNWRPQLERASDPKMLLQFCHGAPGFVICLADLPSAALDELLQAAGETIWTAGPLAKGSNLCHGTAGNGYAFLKLYQRTKDCRWLERARSFAMHAIAQTEEDAIRFGQSRYSLWTGDLGLAIYLWDCLRAEARFPTLDVFYGSPCRAPA